MTREELLNLTDEELLGEAKKMKSNLIISAFIIGIIIGITTYSIMKNSLGLFTLLPLFFALKVFNDPNDSKNNKVLKELLEERNLK